MPQRNQPFTPALSLKGKKIVAVAAGQFGSWALGADGRLYASGADKRDINAFGRVADLRDKKIVAIAVGEGHLLALDIEGKVYGIGLNNGGQLGLGDHANRASFALVSSLADKKIVAIAAGESHSFAIDSNGKLYATGNNGSGRLGDGKREDQQEVFKIVSSLVDKNITQVAAGGSHSLALDADGKVYAAGYNEQGQLGLEGANYRDEFTLVSYFEGRKIVEVAPRYERSLGIDSEGYIVYCAEFAPVFSLADKNITQVAAGGMHSLALGADGKVYAAGSNRYGQLGLGDADIEAGYANARRVFMPVILLDR
jgi:alpha-tubulin suppressor-like RCC1 family protein